MRRHRQLVGRPSGESTVTPNERLVVLTVVRSPDQWLCDKQQPLKTVLNTVTRSHGMHDEAIGMSQAIDGNCLMLFCVPAGSGTSRGVQDGLALFTNRPCALKDASTDRQAFSHRRASQPVRLPAATPTDRICGYRREHRRPIRVRARALCPSPPLIREQGVLEEVR